MSLIRNYVLSNLIAPLKQYPTTIQRTMIELIIQKLERLYDLSWKFPEIVTPTQDRMDIVRAIADQFVFTIRDDADIQEQLDILDNILYLYSKRGSIDTIENMWKYYGGKLPKDVSVNIPSYDLFRYNISQLSGTHTFINNIVSSVVLDTPAPETIYSGSLVRVIGSDRYITTPGVRAGSTSVSLSNTLGLEIGNKINVAGVYEGKIIKIDSDLTLVSNRPGIIEIKLINNTYPLDKLREFLIDELIAAGTEFYFTNELHMNITDSLLNPGNMYKYEVLTDDLLMLELGVLKYYKGYTWSGYGALSSTSDDNSTLLSGKGSIYTDLMEMLDLGPVDLQDYAPYRGYSFSIDLISEAIRVNYEIAANEDSEIQLNQSLYCTPTDSSLSIARYLYNSQGELIESRYPGYFILAESLLGEEVI